MAFVFSEGCSDAFSRSSRSWHTTPSQNVPPKNHKVTRTVRRYMFMIMYTHTLKRYVHAEKKYSKYERRVKGRIMPTQDTFQHE
jgi:hypothetical protein